MKAPHKGCSIYGSCGDGAPETCPHEPMRKLRAEHEECFFAGRYERCQLGRPAVCPLEPARELRRKAKREEWSAIVLRKDPSLRHYLDDRDIHCGDFIELQAVETRYDADSEAYTAPLPGGVVVRYEASQRDGDLRAWLYAAVAGRTFTAGLDECMRFRWPERDR